MKAIILSSLILVLALPALAKKPDCQLVKNIKNEDVPVVENLPLTGSSKSGVYEGKITFDAGNYIYVIVSKPTPGSKDTMRRVYLEDISESSKVRIASENTIMYDVQNKNFEYGITIKCSAN